jgi:hypothetical protein
MGAPVVPQNSLLHYDNSHLYCVHCNSPLHHPVIQDVIDSAYDRSIIRRSIDQVRDILNDPESSNLWWGQRGTDAGLGEDRNELRSADIDPIYQNAISEVREGLSSYGLNGGHDLNGMIEKMFFQKMGRPPQHKRDIINFIAANNIKNYSNTNHHVGGLSSLKKMPGGAEDLPTSACAVGSALRGIPGSTCEACYADAGKMILDNTQKGQWNNLLGLKNPHQYAAALAFQIKHHSEGDLVRLFGSGDIQSAHHFALLADVARANPEKNFWLATREHNALKEYLDHHGMADDAIPDNLNVRMSTHYRGKHINESSGTFQSLLEHPNVTASSVNAAHHSDEVWSCPATDPHLPDSEKNCVTQNCNACWDPNVKWIDYTGHGSKRVHSDLTPDEVQRSEEARERTKQRIKMNQTAIPLDVFDGDIGPFSV